jgi:hypothetical protein
MPPLSFAQTMIGRMVASVRCAIFLAWQRTSRQGWFVSFPASLPCSAENKADTIPKLELSTTGRSRLCPPEPASKPEHLYSAVRRRETPSRDRHSRG